jgi:carbamoyltransferase
MSTDMDLLVINNYLFRKTDQIDWENKNKWMVKFKAD